MTQHTDDAFDLAARRAHAASLPALSPRVQAQLAQRRHAALAPASIHRRRAPWAWGTAFASVAVLAVALQLRPPIEQDLAATPVQRAVATDASGEAPTDPGAVLAEDPDFYAWLASAESPAPTED